MIKVKKRNGTIVDFNKDKIVSAVNKALKAAKIDNNEIGKDIAHSIYQSIDREQVTIEEIHGMVETELMEKGFSEAARSYILYRYKKKEKLIRERQEKKKLLNIDGMLDVVSEKFSLNSLRVLESRYLIKDENMKIIETPTQLFERIATHVGCANIMYDERVFDKEGKQDNITTTATRNMKGEFEYELSIGKYKLNKYNIEQLYQLFLKLHDEGKIKTTRFNVILEMIESGEFDKYEKTIKSYFDLMVNQKFMPNTPTIANAGNKLGQLSACFVIDMEDNIESIMDTAKNMAIIFKSGGGVGINYGKLREEGAPISTTSGTSSGPISFMNIINTVTDTVKQGGKRRGANMGSMSSSHPDILKFIHAKETPGVLENFNVSVGIDAKFWECYKENKPYELISPSTGKVKATVNPRDFMKEIARSAWASSEPGVLLFDNANKYNVMKPLKNELNSTNPCFHPDTLIETVEGQKKIKDITEPTMVYSCDQNGKLVISKATASWKTRESTETLKITMNNGKSLIITPDHYLLNHDLKWIKGKDLHVRDRIVSFCRARRGACYSGVKLSTEGNREYKMEHRFIYEGVNNIELNKLDDIHHKDGNTYNNNINNLELISHDSHARFTAYTQPNNHQVIDESGRFITHENSKQGQKTIVIMPEHLRTNLIGIPRIVKIEEGPITDVYDISVENTHNVIANGIVAHNCGEQYLYPYESCNLGSINLTKFVKNKIFDFEAFGKTIETCVDFLDSVIDVNKYPIPEIDRESWNTRRIGLGTMGAADMLYMLEIPYNSKESYELQEQIAQFMTYVALLRSVELAKSRGSFPYFGQTECKNGMIDVVGSIEGGITFKAPAGDWAKLREDIQEYGLRNVNVTMIAPTGSISMIADCSSGIEPVFALAFEKKVAVGNFYYVNPYLESYLKKHNIDYDEELLKTIAKSGSCQNVDLPDDVKKIFVTSMDIHGIDHVVAQAVWQRWMTNAVSKTCNLPNNVTPDDVENIYLFAHEIGLKGITIYRDGSRETQVLYTENMENKQLKVSDYGAKIYSDIMDNDVKQLATIRNENSRVLLEATDGFHRTRYQTSNVADCPKCGKQMIKYDGCKKCPDVECGMSLC